MGFNSGFKGLKSKEIQKFCWVYLKRKDLLGYPYVKGTTVLVLKIPHKTSSESPYYIASQILTT